MSGFGWLGAAAFALMALLPRTAAAHCDTLDGPAVADGRRALETGNLNYALKWIFPDGEAELRATFEQCLPVRGLGPQAQAVADRLFLETLVRIHRAGEGEGFDGLKPSGTKLRPAVVAADEAIAVGSLDPLRAVVPEDRLPELDRRLQAALAVKEFAVDDVAAGRRYVAAYVDFFKYAEGEEHHHGHATAAGHGAHVEHGHHEHGHAHAH